MAFIEPLNLEQILLVTLAGNEIIFTFLFIIAISALAASFKMPNAVFGVMLVVFGVFFANFIGGLYLILILIAGFVAFAAVAEKFK